MQNNRHYPNKKAAAPHKPERKAPQASMKQAFHWPTGSTKLQKWFSLQLSQHALAIRLSLKNILKTPFSTLMALLAIGITLSLPIALHSFLKNAQIMTQHLEYRGTLTLYLDKNITPNEVQTLQNQLQHRFTVIQDSHFITQDAALAEFKAQADIEEILNLLPENPLHPMLALKLNTKQVPLEEAKQLKSLLEEYPQVVSSDLDYDWVEKLQAFLNLGKALANTISILIGLGILFIIGNIIRMSLTERQEELEVFTLIGATPSFIRRPFIYHGICYGAFGALIALVIISIATLSFKQPVADLAQLYHGVFTISPLNLKEILVIFFYCCLLGGLGAWTAFYQQQKAVS